MQIDHLHTVDTGGMAEWSIAPVLKTGDSLRGPRVRISLPPRAPKTTRYALFLFVRARGREIRTAEPGTLWAGELRPAFL